MTKALDPTNPQQEHPPSEREPATNDAQEVAPLIRTLIEVPEPIIQEYRANQQKQQTEASRNHRLALGAVIGTYIYAAITAAILVTNLSLVGATKKQAAVADEAMRISERPYVDVGRLNGGPIAEWTTDASGKQQGLKIWFRNVGTTPAQRLYVNGNPMIAEFLHLTLKPARPKMIGRGFEIGPGEEVGMDQTHGLFAWIRGTILPARSELEVSANALGEQQITAQLKRNKDQGFQITGNFEYMNVFNEYCCEPFILRWEKSSGNFTSRPAIGERKYYCAPDIPNVCEQRGEP